MRHVLKIVIAREQYEVVADAELRKEGVDSSYLHASTTADIAKLCRIDVILPVWHQQGQSGESLNDLFASFGTREPLQQLLQNEAGSQDRIAIFQSPQQDSHLWDR